jgi:hypothetical protein
LIQWAAPNNNGSPVTSYSVYIGKADLTFALELQYCDGSSADVLANHRCRVPQDILKAEPFLLDQGFSVYAKLFATNQFGDSIMSEVGNGALIALVPTSPLSLTNRADVTNYSSIGLQWEPCDDDGGALVIDYELYFAEQSDFTF